MSNYVCFHGFTSPPLWPQLLCWGRNQFIIDLDTSAAVVRAVVSAGFWFHTFPLCLQLGAVTPAEAFFFFFFPRISARHSHGGVSFEGWYLDLCHTELKFLRGRI